jgi:fibronectin type 3 domain-containing protein
MPGSQTTVTARSAIRRCTPTIRIRAAATTNERHMKIIAQQSKVIHTWGVIAAALAFSISVQAYQGMPVRPLQVVGRYLKDDTGKIVILHGWMAPAGSYWNGRTFNDPVEYTPEECAPALDIYKLQIEVLTRTNAVWGMSHGSYHSFVRYGEAPGWDATNNLLYPDRYDRYINNLLVPYVDYCASRGVYVCVGGGASTTNWMSAQHKANLVELFRRLAGNPGIKNKANVMFEICNEPVDIESVLGNGDWGSSQDKYDKAMQLFMQDIADAIRSTGSTNVIWIPGQVWQARLQNFAKYPVAGINIGYAGHWYPIGEDNPTNICNGFTNDWKKCSDVAPIIVTEGSWNTMATNQGLRTGTTAGFGKTQRSLRDAAENISWMAGMNGEVIGNLDWPPGGTNYTFPDIACGQAAFDWWPSYTWCAPSSGGAEVVLEQSLKIGDKLEVKSGQTGAQSFKYGPVPGGPDFQVSKLRLYLSKSASAPTANLVVSLGTTLNGGTIASSTVNITPASVTDSSGGSTFMICDITYSTPIGPLNAGTTYYINFSTTSANSYFVQMSSLADSHTGTVDDLYPRGAAYSNTTDMGEDVRFILSGTDLPTVPAAPTGLTATPVAGNQLKVSWVDSRIAAGYNVKRSLTNGGPFTTIATNIPSNYFTDAGLVNGTTYYYVVSAVNPAGESTNSVQVSATSKAKLTGPVIGSPGSWGGGGNTIDKAFDGNLSSYYDAVNASGDWAGLDLDTTAVVSEIRYCPRGGFAGRMVGGQFQGANVADFSGGVVTLFTIATAPPEGVFTVQPVSNPTGFRYLRYIGPANGFCNVAEVEFWGNGTPTPPPAAPTGLAATGSNQLVALSWNASSGATSYNVKRSTTVGGPYSTITNVSGTSFTDTGLPTNTLYTWTYYYVVSALNGGGEGANSAPASATMPPAVPTRLTATGNDRQVALWWNFPGGATSYNVKRSATNGGPYSTIANVVNNNFTDTGLANGTTYYYVVSALNAGGESANSAEASATPRDLKALYAFEGNVQDSSGNGNHGTANAVSYVAGKVGAQAAQFNGTSSYVLIPRSITDDFTVALWVKTTDTAGSAGAQWWSGKGLVDGEVGGGGADWGTAIVNGKFVLGVGSASGDTTIASSININDGTWHHVAATRNNTNGAMQVYVDGVLRGSGTGPTGSRTWPPNLRIGSLQTGNNFLNGALDDVRLYVRILTANEIAALITPPPTMPTNLVATAGDAQVALSWSASSNATSYYVKRSTVNGSGYVNVATNASLAFTNTGLNNGTLYYFVVSAWNSASESTNSAQVSARPTSFAPVAISATNVSGQLRLSWPADHTGWQLQSQTNNLATGLGTNWVNIIDSVETNQMTLPLDATNSAVFFRLARP